MRRTLLHNSKVVSHSFTDDGFAVLVKPAYYELANEYEFLIGRLGGGLADPECQDHVYLGGNPIVHLVKSSAYSAGQLYSEAVVSTTTSPLLAYMDLRGEDTEPNLFDFARHQLGHVDPLAYCSVGDSLWAVTQEHLLQWSLSHPFRDPQLFPFLQGTHFDDCTPEIKGAAANTSGIIIGVECPLKSSVFLFDLDGNRQDYELFKSPIIKVFAEDKYFWVVTTGGVERFKVTHSNGLHLVSTFKSKLPCLCATAQKGVLYVGYGADEDKSTLQLTAIELNLPIGVEGVESDYLKEIHKPQVPVKDLLDVHVNDGYAYFLYKDSTILGYPLEKPSSTKPQAPAVLEH
jgi:hypothetical protein